MSQVTLETADELRRRILDGRLVGGQRLGESDVAAALSVSRTPVREALSRLAAEGLVELSPNRGARVASWSHEKLREIFELRLRLEPFAVHQAVAFLTAGQLDEGEQLAVEMDQVGGAGPGQDLDGLVPLNRRFHELFIRASGNAAVAGALRGVIHSGIVTRNFHDYTPEALARSLAHHHEMIAAARAGEGAWAESIMRAHLFNARLAMLGGGRSS